jgi:hypothetical protein
MIWRMENQNTVGNACHYSAQISADDLLVLNKLIGITVHRVYASCLQVRGQHLTAPNFAIPITSEMNAQRIHKYFNFRCKWFETPHTLTDYWQIVVSHDDKPHDFEVHPEKGLIAPCTVNYFRTAPINKIEIYEFQSSAGEGQNLEAVTYDKAIHVHLADGKSFGIACQLNGPGIATEVHISDHDETIETFLDGSRLRLSIG